MRGTEYARCADTVGSARAESAVLGLILASSDTARRRALSLLTRIQGISDVHGAPPSAFGAESIHVRRARLSSRQVAGNAAPAQLAQLETGTGAPPNEQPLSRTTMASLLGGALTGR